jgi:hypothetical protein
MLKNVLLKTALSAALVVGAGAAQAASLGTNGNLETGAFDSAGSNWVVFPNGGSAGIIAPGSDASGPASKFAIEAVAVPGVGATIKFANVGAGVLTSNQAFTVNFDRKGSTAGISGGLDIRIFSELSGGGVSQTTILASGAQATAPAEWTSFGIQNLNTGAGDVGGGVTVEFTAICGGVEGCSSSLAIDDVVITADVAAATIPAAAWLLGSALLGRGGITRSKRNAA